LYFAGSNPQFHSFCRQKNKQYATVFVLVNLIAPIKNARKNICENLTDKDHEIMSEVALGLEPLWENALGKDWKNKINPQFLLEIYQKI
jgi:hypothetical protein